MAKAEYTDTSERASHKAFVESEEGDVSEGRDFTVEGNDTSEYVGTDVEYQNYADDTHKPLSSEATTEALEADTPSDDRSFGGNSSETKSSSEGATGNKTPKAGKPTPPPTTDN